MQHERIASVLIVFLGGLVLSRKLGVACNSSTAFKIKSGNQRSSDISFVAKDRLKRLKKLSKGFFDDAPDLATEVTF